MPRSRVDTCVVRLLAELHAAGVLRSGGVAINSSGCTHPPWPSLARLRQRPLSLGATWLPRCEPRRSLHIRLQSARPMGLVQGQPMRLSKLRERRSGEAMCRVRRGDSTSSGGHKQALIKACHQTGAIDKQKMHDVRSVKPECPSAKESAEMSRYSREINKQLKEGQRTAHNNNSLLVRQMSVCRENGV